MHPRVELCTARGQPTAITGAEAEKVKRLCPADVFDVEDSALVVRRDRGQGTGVSLAVSGVSGCSGCSGCSGAQTARLKETTFRAFPWAFRRVLNASAFNMNVNLLGGCYTSLPTGVLPAAARCAESVCGRRGAWRRSASPG